MTDEKRRGHVEVRKYVETILMFFDADGNLVGEEPRGDNFWHDTVETRPMTDREMEGWL